MAGPKGEPAGIGLLDLTLRTPEENLALDEALLAAAEASAGRETLRFWESPVPFVVLGVARYVRLVYRRGGGRVASDLGLAAGCG